MERAEIEGGEGSDGGWEGQRWRMEKETMENGKDSDGAPNQREWS